MVYEVVEDKNYNNPQTVVMADQLIKFTGTVTKKNNSEIIRRIIFYDADGNRTFIFYTNNMILSAEDIALAYKYRWHVELFFKWVKQHLHVKEFYGTRKCGKDTTLLSHQCLLSCSYIHQSISHKRTFSHFLGESSFFIYPKSP